MHADLLTVFLAFAEGFALIISPCILPILPIVLSGALAGNKARPFGIIAGFVITFAIVTLFSTTLIAFTHISQDTLRTISLIILFLLGCMMMSTRLTDKFNLSTQRLTRVGSSIKSANNPQSGFLGGLLFGGLIGIIWTPCAGPIFAAVIVQVVIQQTTIGSVLVIISFAIGAGLPMLLIALLGRQVMNKFTFIRRHTVFFRKLLGLIIIASVAYLVYSANVFTTPVQANQSESQSATKLINGLEHPYKAPDIIGIDAWINSPALQLTELKGKVVLIDFWTYSCINCLRTLPYLKDWYAKYHDSGFVIIGVHSPEFEFEHNPDNVRKAVLQEGILYPVALDNHFDTWQNYHNEYWPAHYLINKEGDVVYQHFGEGEYDITENNIRYLLGMPNARLVSATGEEKYSSTQTPETYLGYERAENFVGPLLSTKNKSEVYRFPDNLDQNQWALQGKWAIRGDRIIAMQAGASIRLHFKAGNVYAVMGGPLHAVPVTVQLDGKPVTYMKGKDMVNSQVIVNQYRLYSLIDFKQQADAILELTATEPGLEIYSFTFGD